MELRTLETLCIGKKGALLPHSFYKYAQTTPRNELEMHEDCIRCFRRLGWKLVAHEWKAKHQNGKHGVGDLVFQRGKVFVVMECKRRNKQKVYDQAVFYAMAWAHMHRKKCGNVTLYGVWTLSTQELLGRLYLANFCALNIGEKE